jgi:formylglycine-generating enzyme required for sulfatase activity
MRLIFVTPPPGNSRASARGFFLAELETTEDQWAKIMPQYQTNMIYGDSSAKTWNSDGTYYHPAQDHPVCQVSLPDALAFVQKLSDQEGKNYRLPTVTEWEHACLAGQPASNSPGAVLDKVAWFHDNAARKGETHPHRVGKKQANDWGFHDMLGNVAEWCTPEKGDLTKAFAMGGSWNDPSEAVNPSQPAPLAASKRERTIGFRIALTLR